ncbi:methylenetetrahydrofolate dehydrogenase [Ephemerocybe angulata]|uniref:Methylenetetrahydrofolate dehydrogenase n=1 Tax=Ephemerocybe angulata TaxID=980116 RepID=A0A8H6IAP1_9AGAR|nr:methylenetetrahydrofolate dehydrogenase [Tulosesus angulatus]
MAAAAPPAPVGKGILLKADPIAATFRDEVKGTLEQCTVRPKLVGILSTSSAPSKFYAEFTKKQCEELGVEFVLKKTGAALDPELGEGEGVEDAIIEANTDSSVHGIMVYFPIFGPQQDHYLQQGLNFKFHYNLYHNVRFLEPRQPSTIDGEVPPPGMVKSIIPCTPLAICTTGFLPYGDRAYGKTITVINRSVLPTADPYSTSTEPLAFARRSEVRVFSEYNKRPRRTAEKKTAAQRYHPRHAVHPSQMTLQEVLAVSDVLKTEWLKDGCICLNVAADKNFEKDIREKASIYIPAVGKVTILMLLRNLLRLQQYQRIQEEVQAKDTAVPN